MSSLAEVLSVLFCILNCKASTGPGCSPARRARYANQWPAQLDFGLYWLGPSNAIEKASRGPSQRLYEPEKPVSVFFHGWQGVFGGTTRTCYRMGTVCEVCLEPVEQMNAWFEQGWNVGMFYWDQFADEVCLRDAEYKIWQPGDKPLRWRSNDCQGPHYEGKEEFHNFDGQSHSVSDICAGNLRSVLADFKGPEVRFVGHSLGAQLAAKCAELLHRTGEVMAPARVVMLEPAFSHVGFFGQLQCENVADSKAFGKVALEKTNAALHKLNSSGALVELYTTTSGLLRRTICSEASRHVYHDFHVAYRPKWCNDLSRVVKLDSRQTAGCYHNSVVALYYLSMGSESSPPVNAQHNVSVNCRVPSAASTLDQTRHLSRYCRFADGSPHYAQSQGLSTLATSDDLFSVSTAGGSFESFAKGSTESEEFASWFKTPWAVAFFIGCGVFIPAACVTSFCIRVTGFTRLKSRGSPADSEVSSEDESLRLQDRELFADLSIQS